MSLVVAAPAPVHAQRYDDRSPHERREHERWERDRCEGAYGYRRLYFRPGYYAPPQVYYAQPLRPYYAPPPLYQAPGFGFAVPFR